MKELFYKYQKPLLKFANHPFGRKFLNLHTDKRIDLITPSSIAWREKDLVKGQIFCGGLARKLGLALTALDIASLKDFKSFLYYLGLTDRPFYAPLIHFTNINVSAGNGYVFGQDATWATIRGAASGGGTGQTYINVQAVYVAPNYYLVRGFLPFDTSSISGIVTVASFFIYANSSYDTWGDADSSAMALTQSTQTSISAIDVNDFNNITLNTPPEGASRINLSAITTGNWIEFALNATGISWIGSTLKLCMRNSRDVDDSAPTGRNHRTFDSADANDPYLSYTAVAVSGNFFDFM